MSNQRPFPLPPVANTENNPTDDLISDDSGDTTEEETVEETLARFPERKRAALEYKASNPTRIDYNARALPFSPWRQPPAPQTATMSDSETPAPPHPNLGGKSLQSLERPRYKSWRKKYRKMRFRFDGVLEENKRLFKEEQKLEGIAKRLREELDGLLELCLDLNSSPSIPPHLRFDIGRPRHQATPDAVPANITPEEANNLLMEYTAAVRAGQIPPLDLHVVRQQIDEKLAVQEVRPLSALEAGVSHPNLTTAGDVGTEEDMGPSYLTIEQEAEYLARLDARNPLDQWALTSSAPKEAAVGEEKHWAELTPRELERQVELLNPQSQHNWLKTHSKGATNLVDDDNESLASHDTGSKPAASSRKRGGKDKNLAKQVGDRAVERAKEGMSPSAASDEEATAGGSGGRKRARDPDSTYRVKGSKGQGSAAKGSKRKRSAVEDTGSGTGRKKVKVEDDGEDGDELGGP